MECDTKQLNKDLFVNADGLFYISEIQNMLLLGEWEDCTPNILYVEEALIRTTSLVVSSRETTGYIPAFYCVTDHFKYVISSIVYILCNK